MTITDNIRRISNAKASIRESIINKGIAVSDSALLDEYPALIDSIGLINAYKDLYDMRTNNGTNMAGLFSYCTASELDLSSLDTSKATDMKNMFANCSSSVNIDGWDTSKVTNMYNMFSYFSGSIDISKLDTSSVTDVIYMFNSTKTDNVILTGLSFPSTTRLDNMFASAEGIILDLSSWDISNITNMSSAFSSSKYKRINLTGWKTTNVTNMYYMFNTYSNPLEELIIPDWDMTNVTNSSGFMNPSYMSNLKLIDLSRSNDTTITKIASFLPTRTATTFGDVIVPSNTSQATYDTLIAKYWRPIGADLTPVPTSIEIVSELDEIVLGMNNSTRVYLGNCEPWYADLSKVDIVILDESIATIEGDTITSTGIIGNIELKVRIIDTQEAISTKTIHVSETDSYPNVVKFRLASTPASYNTVITVNDSSKKLSNLTYDSITDIYSYDAGVPITSIKFNSYIGEIVKLNTSNVTSMNSMFSDCSKLTLIDTNSFDISKATKMQLLFYNCTSLTELDLSNWYTNHVLEMVNMFSYCSNLTSIDIRNFDMTNVTSTYTGNMFVNCTSLHTLRLDNCSNVTINKIITSTGFPTEAISGVTRTIYCKESEAAGLTPPTNWVFSFIDESIEPEEPIEPEGDYITFTVEKFTLGLGYIQEPIRVPFYENETYEDVLVRTLGEENLKYENSGYSFYLSKIRDDDTREPNPPEYILEQCGSVGDRNDEGWLGEYDYTYMSGWMCSVNNNFVYISEFTPNKNDVFRIQFTLCLREDITNGSIIEIANRDKLTEQIALINSSEDKKVLLKDRKIKEAYEDAYEALEDLTATQEEVDSALYNLKNAMNK